MNYPDTKNIPLVTKKGFPCIEKLSEDIVALLQTDLHKRIKQQVLDGALWWVADYSGKGTNCRFKSVEAQKKCGFLTDSNITNQGLVHEHIIPKKLIRKKLVALGQNADTEEVERLLRLSVYCLVTKGEDLRFNKRGLKQKMLNDTDWSQQSASSNDLWARYIDCGIPVVAEK